MGWRKQSYPFRSVLTIFGVCAFVAGAVIYASQRAAVPPVSILGSSDNTATAHAAEFFVPLGYSAVTATGTEWTDVPGVQATIDTTKYPKIKQVLFETTVFGPTGNQTVWLRVRNSDYYSYPVVTMDGSGPKLLTSAAFTLGGGTKTYTVQLKTQLGYPVHIYQARLHITTY